jgi:hypothetical protein
MGSIRVGLGLLLGLCVGPLALAQQPPNTNIRGMVTAFDGKTVVVKARDGTTLEVALPETLAVSGTKAFTLADLKPGMTLGVTTVKRADGQLVAIDVRPIPATARIGLSPFDLQPDSTMTNAILEAQVVSMSGAELTLNINDGTLKVLVPPGTPMSQSIPGNRADVKPGETVFIAARPSPDGKLTAARIQVSTNGVKPTQ